MIRHIVMWNLVEENLEEREKIANNIKSDLESLRDKIEVIEKIEVVLNINKKDKDAKDLALILDIESMDDLKTYAEHPDHVREVNKMKEHVTGRVVIDFEI